MLKNKQKDVPELKKLREEIERIADKKLKLLEVADMEEREW